MPRLSKILTLSQINLKYIVSNFFYMLFVGFLLGAFVTSQIVYPSVTSDYTLLKDLYGYTFKFSLIYMMNFVSLLHAFLLVKDNEKYGKTRLVYNRNFSVVDIMIGTLLPLVLVSSLVLFGLMALFSSQLTFSIPLMLYLFLLNMLLVFVGYAMSLIFKKLSAALKAISVFMIFNFMFPVILLSKKVTMNIAFYLPSVWLFDKISFADDKVFNQNQYLVLLLIIIGASIMLLMLSYYLVKREKKTSTHILETLNIDTILN